VNTIAGEEVAGSQQIPSWIEGPLPTTIDSTSLSYSEKLEILRSSTLYVTCEPCIMCACALRKLGLTQIVYGCMNDKFGGAGGVTDVLDDTGMTIKGGVMAEEGIRMLRSFYFGENAAAPEAKRRCKNTIKK
jgi:tRNA-specific adenosine deaminase 2